MKKRWRILVAEDTASKFTLIEYDISEVFGSSAEVIRVKTLAELEQVFSERGRQFSFIVLDANLEDGVTLEFLEEKIKPIFTGPVIANSSSSKNRAMQMEFGCTHEGHKILKKVFENIKASLSG